MSLERENIDRNQKQVFVCDIDAVLVDPRRINALWLPGSPKPEELPADESAMAEEFRMDLHDFYRKKDVFLKSSEALDVRPIKDSQEVLGLIAVNYEIVFASARVNAVHSHTLSWLEKHYGHHVGNLQEDLRLFTVGSDTTHYIDSKAAIYSGFGATAMIDDRRQHHEEATDAGVPTRIYYQDSSMGGVVRSGATPEGSKLAGNFREVLGLLVQTESGDRISTPACEL